MERFAPVLSLLRSAGRRRSDRREFQRRHRARGLPSAARQLFASDVRAPPETETNMSERIDDCQHYYADLSGGFGWPSCVKCGADVPAEPYKGAAAHTTMDQRRCCDTRAGQLHHTLCQSLMALAERKRAATLPSEPSVHLCGRGDGGSEPLGHRLSRAPISSRTCVASDWRKSTATGLCCSSPCALCLVRHPCRHLR